MEKNAEQSMRWRGDGSSKRKNAAAEGPARPTEPNAETLSSKSPPHRRHLRSAEGDWGGAGFTEGLRIKQWFPIDPFGLQPLMEIETAT